MKSYVLAMFAGLLTFLSPALGTPQTVLLSDNYIINGQVLDDFGRIAPPMQVCAGLDVEQRERPQFCSWSTIDGDFIIPVTLAGRYTVYARKGRVLLYAQMPFFRYPGFAFPQTVVNEKTRTSRVVIKLPPKNGELFGKAIDATTGRPIENLRFVVCHMPRKTNCFSASAKNANGELNVLAAHVPFSLEVMANGYETWFGLNGYDINQSISIPSGSKMELQLHLRRRPEFINQPLSEAEKQPGLNLPAPIQTAPEENAEFDYYPRKTKLEWNAVKGAVSYRVELDYCQGGSKRTKRICLDPQPHYMGRDVSDSFDTSFEFYFVGAQPGRWRVWAIDQKGQEGFKSPWRLFFYWR